MGSAYASDCAPGRVRSGHASAPTAAARARTHHSLGRVVVGGEVLAEVVVGLQLLLVDEEVKLDQPCGNRFRGVGHPRELLGLAEVAGGVEAALEGGGGAVRAALHLVHHHVAPPHEGDLLAVGKRIDVVKLHPHPVAGQHRLPQREGRGSVRRHRCVAEGEYSRRTLLPMDGSFGCFGTCTPTGSAE